MPKKPKIETPLRKLREITGKSQIEFARALGCSTSVIKKIEGGDNSRLNPQLLMAASFVFAVEPNSLVPPSTQPIKLEDGKPYTKEFFNGWWNIPPEILKARIQPQKMWMLRDLELVVAAAMRVPGISVGGVIMSFHIWVKDTMTNFNLLPHYDAEFKERIKKARKKPNKTQADWELVKLFCENKPKFIQEAFEADVSPTLSLMARAEADNQAKEEGDQDWKKKSKQEKLKLGSNLMTKTARKIIQAGTATNAGPKLKR
jgi:transcriptional regulator with XRE-family HTH domain